MTVLENKPTKYNLDVKIIHANGNSVQIEESFRKHHGVTSESVNAENLLQEKEPEGGDLEAALWKLGVGQIYPFTVANQAIMVISSDVEYFDPLGISRLKANRMKDEYGTDEEGYKSYLEEIAKETAAAFEIQAEESITVEWLVAFGFQLFWVDEVGKRHSSEKKVVRLKIMTEFFNDPPTPEFIESNFKDNMNPGFELAEQATTERATSMVSNNTDGEEEWVQLKQEVLQLLVVDKVVPQALLSQLAMGESRSMELDSKEIGLVSYQQVAVSLLGLS